MLDKCKIYIAVDPKENWTTIKEHRSILLDVTYGIFEVRNLEDLVLSGQDFIYIIILTNNDIFEKFTSIDLPRNLIESIYSHKAKLLLYYPQEGNFGTKIEHFKWVHDLSNKYQFCKSDIIVITGNMIADEQKEKLISTKLLRDNFTVYPFSWFSYCLYPHQGSWKLDVRRKHSMYASLCVFLEKNRFNYKEYHFLCLNRQPKDHRLSMFAELRTNPNFIDKYITSLGNNKIGGSDESDFFLAKVKVFLKDDYKHSKQRIINFFKDYDASSHYVFDRGDMDVNHALTFNAEAHSKTFVNIITESLIDETSVFFSEKTFKPMYACQPFILFGNPYSLKKLKEMGFKTFEKWWDESYDNEIDATRRLEKIIDVMIEISTWDMKKCYIITNEMEEILLHNFYNLASDKKTIELYKLLNNNFSFLFYTDKRII